MDRFVIMRSIMTHHGIRADFHRSVYVSHTLCFGFGQKSQFDCPHRSFIIVYTCGCWAALFTVALSVGFSCSVFRYQLLHWVCRDSGLVMNWTQCSCRTNLWLARMSNLRANSFLCSVSFCALPWRSAPPRTML